MLSGCDGLGTEGNQKERSIAFQQMGWRSERKEGGECPGGTKKRG